MIVFFFILPVFFLIKLTADYKEERVDNILFQKWADENQINVLSYKSF